MPKETENPGEGSGYIKIYRSILDNFLWKRSKVKTDFEAFFYLLMMAKFKDDKEAFGYDLIKLKRGQLLTSQLKLSKEFRWDRSRTRCFMRLLEKDNMITTEVTQKYSIITICNYDSYQGQQPTNQQLTNNSTTTEQQLNNTVKNVKKDNKGKNVCERKKDFYELLTGFVEKYPKVMLRKFYDYWSETNQAGIKMRWEMEKTFEIEKRLAYWASRDDKFSKVIPLKEKQDLPDGNEVVKKYSK